MRWVAWGIWKRLVSVGESLWCHRCTRERGSFMFSLIRDAMVEKIWEGTINVCALDLTRATTKDPDAVASFTEVRHPIIHGYSGSPSGPIPSGRTR